MPPQTVESVGNAGPVILATIVAGTTVLPYDSGPKMLEASHLAKWTFHLGFPAGGVAFANISVAIYGTTDRGTSGWVGYSPTPLGANWFLLPAESAQGGTGIEQNPLTGVNMSMSWNRPLTAVRIYATTPGGPTGTCIVFGYCTR